ncbi:DUF6221 family protein [Streptomyces sp. NPDC049952]|uniref:DUF6221 family protein n=1 Tax=Streptomyces sp. NPDC049952 TaxID=3156665 RepID=UPI00342C15DF
MAMMRDDFEVKVEFLVARLRADEAAARALKPGKNADVEWLRERILADVQMKRRLLGWMYEPQEKVGDWGNSGWTDIVASAITNQWMRARRPVVEELVLAYANHPDFRPEWLSIEDDVPTRHRSRVGHES